MPSEEKIEEVFFKYRFFLFFILIGIILVGLGLNYKQNNPTEEKLEVLSETVEMLVVEISGEVINPGVYRLPKDSRVEDLLVAGGGITADADRDYIDTNINRAAKLIDGQKYFVPPVGWQKENETANKTVGYQTISSDFGVQKEGVININTASLTELDALPGIGQKYGTSIIEHRPYSNAEELLSGGVIPKSTYDKIKTMIGCW
jgi:competence protein ComEA